MVVSRSMDLNFIVDPPGRGRVALLAEQRVDEVALPIDRPNRGRSHQLMSDS